MNEAFKKWVDDARARGYSDEQIRASAMQSGYQPASIDEVLKPATPGQPSGSKKNMMIIGAAVAVLIILIIGFFFIRQTSDRVDEGDDVEPVAEKEPYIPPEPEIPIKEPEPIVEQEPTVEIPEPKIEKVCWRYEQNWTHAIPDEFTGTCNNGRVCVERIVIYKKTQWTALTEEEIVPLEQNLRIDLVKRLRNEEIICAEEMPTTIPEVLNTTIQINITTNTTNTTDSTTNESTNSTCSVSAECDDGITTTTDYCSYAADQYPGVCHNIIYEFCLNNTNCNDTNTSTYDSCSVFEYPSKRNNCEHIVLPTNSFILAAGYSSILTNVTEELNCTSQNITDAQPFVEGNTNMTAELLAELRTPQPTEYHHNWDWGATYLLACNNDVSMNTVMKNSISNEYFIVSSSKYMNVTYTT